MSTAASPMMDLANQLAALCREGKNLEAIEKLYADDIVSTEVMGTPEMPARMEGKDAIKGKNQWWFENHEIHGGDVQGPFPHGDQFILAFSYDMTPKCGPMNGQRGQMQECGLYTVRDGKITEEKFFYHMPGQG
ncbi:MAG: nuclear transport factor 2 family protein [Planctomycetota bacterium]